MTCCIEMRSSPDGLGSAVRLLRSVVRPTEVKPGCQGCSVARDARDDSRLRHDEAWSSRDAFHRHVRTGEFRRVLMAMDLCCEEPRVTIGNLVRRRGLDYLRELHDSDGEVAG